MIETWTFWTICLHQKGQAFLLVIITVAVVLMATLALIAGSHLYYQNTTYTTRSEKALALAEAGIDKAIVSLNKTSGAYSGEAETFLGDGSFSVRVTPKDAISKFVEATGFIPNKVSPKTKRTIKIEASRGVGVSFVYGIQVGEGGLELGNSNTVSGSIYSNGNVVGGNSNEVTGDVWVAGAPQADPDQQTDCLGVNCTDFIFGKNVAGDDRLDVAQSFKPQTSALLNKVSLKLKKSGNPQNLTVRILRDDAGSPDKNGVLATGTLFASLVTQNYGLIDVTFTTSPLFQADISYWLMIDTLADPNNFWSWQLDLASSYTRGLPKWSPRWDGDSSWSAINGDLSFKIFMGGSPTSIRGGNNFRVGGDVHANTIENLTIGRDAYFQTIVSSTVAGRMFPGSADPPPKVFPISDANIEQWKREAEGLGVRVGDIISCVSSLGPGKIVGNINFDNSCNVTIRSPIWITGNLNVRNSNTLRLAPEYDRTSGLIVIDGTADFGNSNRLEGTGVGNSLLMLLSTFDSRTNGIPAIKVPNAGNSGVLYASKGIIEPGNSNSFKELTAWKIKLMNSSTITYETGLSSTLFSSGPSGSFTLVKGTYQVR